MLYKEDKEKKSAWEDFQTGSQQECKSWLCLFCRSKFKTEGWEEMQRGYCDKPYAAWIDQISYIENVNL